MRVRRNTKSSPGLAIFMGIIFVFFAVVIFSMGTKTNNMRKRCTKSTTGIVQSVRQERRTRKKGKHRRETYYVYVTGYEFDVDGKEYHGSSTLNSRISEGATLTISYNPSKPAEEHYSNYDSSGAGGIAASVVFGALGIIVFITGIKEKARQGGSGFSRVAAAGTGVVLNGLNNNNNYNYNNYNSNGYNNGYNNNLNNNYNTYNNDYNNSFGNSNGYSDNNFNNGYNNNYNNSYNNNYNNGYNNGYNNNNVYSSTNNYNDFNQLN